MRFRASERFLAFFSLAGAILLASCAPATPAVFQPTAGSTPEPTLTPYDGGQIQPPDAVQTAQRLLADTLGIRVQDVTIRTLESVQWNDSCLEAPYPNEQCAQGITPGYRAEMEVNGQIFEFRTDQLGRIVRVAKGASLLQSLAMQAQLLLRDEVGVSLDAVRVMSLERTVFSDACLGLATPGQECAQVQTPGFRIVLEANGQTYEFRASEQSGQVRMVPTGRVTDFTPRAPLSQPAWIFRTPGAPETPQPTLSPQFEQLAQGAVIRFWRTGGIAGFCDEMAIVPDGHVYTVNCKAAGTVKSMALSPSQTEQVDALQQQYGSFSVEYQEPANQSDRLGYRIDFQGEGQGTPDAAQLDKIRVVLEGILSEVSSH